MSTTMETTGPTTILTVMENPVALRMIPICKKGSHGVAVVRQAITKVASRPNTKHQSTSLSRKHPSLHRNADRRGKQKKLFQKLWKARDVEIATVDLISTETITIRV